MQGREDSSRFDGFFGSPRSVDVVKKSIDRIDSPTETAQALLDFYAKQLGRIGYQRVEHSQVVMKNSRNVAQYRLLLAGKHVRAVDFFRKISTIDPTGQRRLY